MRLKLQVILSLIVVTYAQITGNGPYEVIADCNEHLCIAELSLKENAGVTTLYTKFQIAPKSGTKDSITTITQNAFFYLELENRLYHKAASSMKNADCAVRRDMIASSIKTAAISAMQSCTMGDCTAEQPVYTCGIEPTAARVEVPWQVLFDSDASQFDEDPSNYNILFALLRYTELDKHLARMQAGTLLAPNDAAITQSAKYLANYLGNPRNETMVFDALTNHLVLSKGGTSITDALRFILSYHIIEKPLEGVYFSGLPKVILSLSSAHFLSAGSGELVDVSTTIPNPYVTISDLFVQKENVVHSISGLMVPYEVGMNYSNSC